MTRQIKFQIFDVGNNEWKTFDLKGLHECGATYHLDYSKVRQFTGLLDKNGKEIYEGYLVKGTTDDWYQDTKTEDIVQVEWDEITCGFSPFSIYDSDCNTGTYHNKVEIIGNIYQNPELLK